LLIMKAAETQLCSQRIWIQFHGTSAFVYDSAAHSQAVVGRV
jgi:hypothetical protein